MNMAGETCSDNALGTVLGEQCAQHLANFALAWCMAFFLGVGAVGHEQTNAAVMCQRTQSCKVGSTTIYWSEVELEVTRVKHNTLCGVQCNGVRMRYRVRNGNEFNIEWSDAANFTIAHNVERGLP